MKGYQSSVGWLGKADAVMVHQKLKKKTHKGSLVDVADLSHSVDTIKKLKRGKE